MEYNREKIIIPEYGKNVQHMVEHALTIEDKAERTRCVQSIMQTMTNLFPYLRNEESRHKIYDHLAIMSDFRLDVDSPYDQPTVESVSQRPSVLAREERPVRYRHYGRIIEDMIEMAVNEPDQQKREQLTILIANRMRQNFQTWNKDVIDREHIEADIRVLSRGRLTCNFEGFYLSNLAPINNNPNKHPNQKKKNKKKNGNIRTI